MQRREWVQGAERRLLPWRLSNSKGQQPQDESRRWALGTESKTSGHSSIRCIHRWQRQGRQRTAGRGQRPLGVVVLLPRLVGCCQRLLLRLPELGQVRLERLRGGGGEW